MKQALFFFVLFFAAMPVFAETVVLKSGRTVEGKILEKTDKYVKIDFEGIALTFYLDEINTIIDQDPKPAKLTKDQKLGITFLVPQEWIRVEEETYPDKGIHTFITSNDPAQRVMLVIRVLRVANQTALQWAIDEVKALEQDKVQIVLQPVEVTFGNTWVTLESKLYTKDASGNTISHKNKQYFTKGEADTMIEVAIMGEESILEKLSSAGRFDAFLSSFDLEEKVKDTNSV